VMRCVGREGPKALTTEGTKDHRGNQRSINVELFDALR
jgi:hypothetical protein